MNRSNAIAVVSLLVALAAACSNADDPCAGSSRCVREVAVGSHFACARNADGTVWCWGRNDESQLGYPTTDTCPEDIGNGQTRAVACHTYPSRVNGLDHVTHVAVGAAFACALRDDGSVWCWGANEAGQLGDGTQRASVTPVEVRGIASATSLSLGARHACAISGGAVSCWGANDAQQLGTTTTSAHCQIAGAPISCSPTAVAVAGLADVAAVRAGATHTCVLFGNRTVACFGDNGWGEVGHGMVGGSIARPTQVLIGNAPLTNVWLLASGAEYSCALRSSGDVVCWGRNDRGQLGMTSAMPTVCSSACEPRAVQVVALRENAAATVGGAAGDGGVGDAATSASMTGAHGAMPTSAPSATPGIGDLTAGDTFACARLDDGTARCWGNDTLGQLGDGQPSADAKAPTFVIAQPGAAPDDALGNIQLVSAGAGSACARLGDGTLRCWGANQDGALGVGQVDPQAGPVAVSF